MCTSAVRLAQKKTATDTKRENVSGCRVGTSVVQTDAAELLFINASNRRRRLDPNHQRDRRRLAIRSRPLISHEQCLETAVIIVTTFFFFIKTTITIVKKSVDRKHVCTNVSGKRTQYSWRWIYKCTHTSWWRGKKGASPPPTHSPLIAPRDVDVYCYG